jgi:glyoxylase-like metal-dependent hydrolase (beta-lactamase superfamily II)
MSLLANLLPERLGRTLATTRATTLREADVSSSGGGKLTFDVAPDVVGLKHLIVNMYFVGPPNAGDRGWVLVDAGFSFSADRIERTARERFGRNARPAAIVLTHGHFDHVGALATLAEKWQAPVYAHELELPYITGCQEYPPPDPDVGGGMMSRLSLLYPRGPVDVGRFAHALPPNGSVPKLRHWQWIPTPGHSPGHVSLFRKYDGVLLAGDAIVTVRQESALAVMAQRREVRPPPAYYTIDWSLAGDSVRRLAALRPSIAATGHGSPMSGPAMLRQLDDLADHFEEVGVPRRGRYVRRPAAVHADGSVTAPPVPLASALLRGLAGMVVVAAVYKALQDSKKPGDHRCTKC